MRVRHVGRVQVRSVGLELEKGQGKGSFLHMDYKLKARATFSKC